MRNLTNSILINNNLKSGKSDSTLKTIELLAKLGLLPKKKKVSKNKIIGYDETGEPIRQNNKMVSTVTYGPPMNKTGPTPSKGPLTIEDINREKEQIEQTQALIKSGQIPPNQLESYQKQLELRFADLQSKLSTMGSAVGFLGMQMTQPRMFTGSNKFNQTTEEPKNDFFPNNKNNETVYYEEDEQDFTNQGSQDIPEKVLKVDVSPSPNEIIEQEQTEYIQPEQKLEEEIKPKIIPIIPTEEEINQIKISKEGKNFNNFTLDALKYYNIEEPSRSWAKPKIIGWIALNIGQSGQAENFNIKDYQSKTVPELWSSISKYIRNKTKDFKNEDPIYNTKTNKWVIQ